MKKSLYIFAIIMLCCAFTISAQQKIPKNYQKKYMLEGLQPWIGEQFIDKEQINNIDWREYQYWLKNIFGSESEEYKASIPDEKILYQQLPEEVAKVYAKSPAYANYPVLGISVEQAQTYCRWRTNRVAEQMLCKMKFMEYNRDQSRENYFSLEKFGEPEGMKFLRFDLPSEANETRYGFRCVAVWK